MVLSGRMIQPCSSSPFQSSPEMIVGSRGENKVGHDSSGIFLVGDRIRLGSSIIAIPCGVMEGLIDILLESTTPECEIQTAAAASRLGSLSRATTILTPTENLRADKG